MRNKVVWTPERRLQEIVLLPESKRIMEALLNTTNLKSNQKFNLSFFIGELFTTIEKYRKTGNPKKPEWILHWQIEQKNIDADSLR